MCCKGCQKTPGRAAYICVIIVSKGKRSCVGCRTKPCHLTRSFRDILLASYRQQLEQLRQALEVGDSQQAAAGNDDDSAIGPGLDEIGAIAARVEAALSSFDQRYPDASSVGGAPTPESDN